MAPEAFRDKLEPGVVRRNLQTVTGLRSFTGALTLNWASCEIPRKFQVYSWERAKLCLVLSTHLSIDHCSFNIVSETISGKRNTVSTQGASAANGS